MLSRAERKKGRRRRRQNKKIIITAKANSYISYRFFAFGLVSIALGIKPSIISIHEYEYADRMVGFFLLLFIDL